MNSSGGDDDFAWGDDVDSYWQDYQRRRWLRPNAHLYVHPDAARWLQPDQRLWQGPDFAERKYNADQPRVPAGNSDGGQWTTVSSGGGISIAVPVSDRFEGDGAAGGDTGETGTGNLGQLAGDIPTGDPPEIPEERPPTSPERSAALKATARLLGPISTVAEIAELGVWLRTYSAQIQSYSDPPKSLEELQRAVSTPANGYDIHHIVEQTQAEKDGFTREVIDGPDNLVLIPRLKHQEITGWYQTKNDDFGDLSPREYLSGRNWEIRKAVGLDALRIFGVLKP
ncbi:MAG: hypothetical protein ACRECA_00155 [Pseudolabrys sp.]